ncbi:hypothetical protein HYC85_010230 [Camellia sinensis]|uniref:Protein kinase domain-containing protein n=1 Tax=Camellia sinensis TaxID=4442 RepID=A0A7J7HK33_CAMSI|nr:hypothetical protein HYC85_010230 [Camellia sinensis]
MSAKVLGARSSATGVITGEVVAGVTLLFLILAWWQRRKPEDSFVDVPRKGRFGKEYKGRLVDGSPVAVKILKEEHTQGGELQFQTEMEMGNQIHNPHLIGPKGNELHWDPQEALHICTDHCNPKIIHRDVKAANILLDEKFEVVVGDFGLAKLMDYKDTHVTTAVRGTIGHIAPEYLSTGKSSEKTNVFGYGVMLLELITGQMAFDPARRANDDDIMLLVWVKGLLKDRKLETLVDANMKGNYVKDEVEQLIQVALLCTLSSPMERPKMSEVVRMLEGDGLAERWEEWQKEEMFWQEFVNIHHQNNDWTIAQVNNLPDSTHNHRPEELSGPR